MPEFEYKINSDEAPIPVIPAMFTVENVLCGDINLQIVEDATTSPIRFEDDIFSVFTSDLSLAGTS